MYQNQPRRLHLVSISWDNSKEQPFQLRNFWNFILPVFARSLNMHAQFITTRYPSTYQTTLKGLQKRPLRIIYPWMPYTDSLEESGLPRLFEWRQLLTGKLFNEITQDQSHKLRSLLRRKRKLNVPRAKTDRFMNSFIVSNCKYF